MTATVSGIHLTGTHAARPGAAGPPAGSLYSCTTDSKIYRTDGTSWSDWANFAASGIPATIFDAAGDLIVASAADTAARLAIGAAGGAVSRVNGAVAWNSGTAFPTAVAGDRFWRTDLEMEFLNDGTRWKCTCPHVAEMGNLDAGLSGSGTGVKAVVSLARESMSYWIESIDPGVWVDTTNNGTHHWSAQLQRNAVNTWVNVGSAVTTAAISPSDWATIHADIDTAIALADGIVFRIFWTKVSSPGNIFGGANMSYRYVTT